MQAIADMMAHFKIARRINERRARIDEAAACGRLAGTGEFSVEDAHEGIAAGQLSQCEFIDGQDCAHYDHRAGRHSL